MKKKTTTIILIIFIIFIAGILVIINSSRKSLFKNSDNVVTLRLPVENSKILEYKEKIVSGDSAFLLLKRVTGREKIYLGYKNNEDGFLDVYKIGQVGGLIMDCGLELLINNKEVLQSPDKYFLTPGDEIQWAYKCEDK